MGHSKSWKPPKVGVCTGGKCPRNRDPGRVHTTGIRVPHVWFGRWFGMRLSPYGVVGIPHGPRPFHPPPLVHMGDPRSRLCTARCPLAGRGGKGQFHDAPDRGGKGGDHKGKGKGKGKGGDDKQNRCAHPPRPSPMHSPCRLVPVLLVAGCAPSSTRVVDPSKALPPKNPLCSRRPTTFGPPG